MRFGLHLPNTRECADPAVLAEIAVEAEAAGWDGAFVWDTLYLGPGHPHFPEPQASGDVWIALAAMAQQTTRIRLGPLLCAPARHEPWYLARKAAALDLLSHGRMVFPVGFGDINDGGFRCVGRDGSLRTRVDRLDESLDILCGLWSGEPFQYAGTHFQIDKMVFHPTPQQRPRIPVWVWALWPRMKTIRRALRYDGVFAFGMNEQGEWHELTPAQVSALHASVTASLNGREDYDVIMESSSPFDPEEKPVALVREYADAGVSWWLDATYKNITLPGGSLDSLVERVRRGPPDLRPA